MAVSVIKSSGELVLFEENKLRNSLERSGAAAESVNSIVSQIRSELFEGMTTKQIYKKAFSLLRKASRPTAGRYKLRRGITELGPSGYPFERFVGELIRSQGYEVKVGVMVKGKSVDHEIDVWAERGNEVILVECKFHQRAELKCDVKVPMYIWSRYNDVRSAWQKERSSSGKKLSVWIVTNTQFSGDAEKFARSYGITLVSWNKPEHGSLRERIDMAGLFPLTCLTTLNRNEKKQLLGAEMVLVREILDHPESLDKIGVDSRKKNRILKEATEICRR